MFFDSSFLNLSEEYQQIYHPIFRKRLYQEDINKCMSFVNSDYNSYDASLDFEHFTAESDEQFLRDSGNATDLNENSAAHTNKKLHSHVNEKDCDNCVVCHNTAVYLLKTPFINYYDYKFAESSISLCSDETTYDEYKILDKFQFSKSRKMTKKDSPHCPSMSPCLLINDLHEIQMDFEMNGKTIENFHPSMLFGDDEENRLFTQPFKDHQNELFEFQPAANSTPAKFVLNKTKGMKRHNDRQNYLSNNLFSWKKPIVLDPRLSAVYDAVFPSLEVSSNLDFVKQQPSSTIQNSFFCAFCKTNKASPEVYKSHVLRDLTGRICCPILRKHKCPRCGAFGDYAHTNKYCPKNPNVKVIFVKKNQSFYYKL